MILAFRGRLRLPALTRKQQCRHSSDIVPVKMNFTEWQSAERTDRAAAPVVIMHGLGGSQSNWRSVARLMIAKCPNTVYTVDARNHGASPHSAEHTAAHLAADVAQFMGDLNLTKIIALGHSMGGYAMMSMALNYPDLVERAIIVDVSPIELPTQVAFPKQLTESIANYVAHIPADRSLAAARKAAVDQFKDSVGCVYLTHMLFQTLRKSANGDFSLGLNLKVLSDFRHNFRNFRTDISHLEPYEGPTLFIAGTMSDFVQEWHIPEIREIFPNMSIEWVETNHYIHFNRPHKFLKLVHDFIE